MCHPVFCLWNKWYFLLHVRRSFEVLRIFLHPLGFFTSFIFRMKSADPKHFRSTLPSRGVKGVNWLVIDDLAARTPTHFRCLYRWASIDCSFSKLPIVIFCSSCGISVLFLTPTETMKARDEGFCNIVCMKTLFFVFNFIFWVSESLAKSFQTNPNFCFERTVKVLFKRAG